MSDIILTTLNAKYPHCAFGLRYLMANLGELQSRARIVEFDINQRPVDIVEAILRHEPKIVGIGVYIWNAMPSLQVVADLKRLRPELVVIIGGPEVRIMFGAMPGTASPAGRTSARTGSAPVIRRTASAFAASRRASVSVRAG